jgi:hypothetical protein
VGAAAFLAKTMKMLMWFVMRIKIGHFATRNAGGVDIAPIVLATEVDRVFVTVVSRVLLPHSIGHLLPELHHRYVM